MVIVVFKPFCLRRIWSKPRIYQTTTVLPRVLKWLLEHNDSHCTRLVWRHLSQLFRSELHVITYQPLAFYELSVPVTFRFVEGKEPPLTFSQSIPLFSYTLQSEALSWSTVLYSNVKILVPAALSS